MKRAYLATSYTWKSRWGKAPIIGKMLSRFVEYVRYRRITKATAFLLKETGWNIFSPITHSHALTACGIPERLNTHTFWLGLDFDWIDACDELWVYMQPGWMKSYGVQEEIKLALNKGMKVRYVHAEGRWPIHFDYPPIIYECPTD